MAAGSSAFYLDPAHPSRMLFRRGMSDETEGFLTLVFTIGTRWQVVEKRSSRSFFKSTFIGLVSMLFFNSLLRPAMDSA